MRSKVFDEALQLPDSSSHPSVTINMLRFLQKLDICTGKNAEIIHEPMKLSKLKVKSIGVDPNFREVVTVVVYSFTGPLGDWDADHADEIFTLDSIH